MSVYDDISELEDRIRALKATARKRNKKIGLLKAQCKTYKLKIGENTFYENVYDALFPESELAKMVSEYSEAHDQLGKIKDAVHKYHKALDNREHGAVAAHNLVDSILGILDMHWKG